MHDNDLGNAASDCFSDTTSSSLLPFDSSLFVTIFALSSERVALEGWRLGKTSVARPCFHLGASLTLYKHGCERRQQFVHDGWTSSHLTFRFLHVIQPARDLPFDALVRTGRVLDDDGEFGVDIVRISSRTCMKLTQAGDLVGDGVTSSDFCVYGIVSGEVCLMLAGKEDQGGNFERSSVRGMITLYLLRHY